MNTAIKPLDAPIACSVSTGYPDKSGYFGIFGGNFIADSLMDPESELQEHGAGQIVETHHKKMFSMVNGMRLAMDDIQVPV